MKYIPPGKIDESYYPKPEEISMDKASAFTLIPGEEDPEMYYAHYFIKYKRFQAELALGEGYMYILENKGQPGILKIGYTDRSPQDRVKEINRGTGVITPWYIANTFACKSPDIIESLVHARLHPYRLNKEGFAVTLPTAEQIIKNIIEENNAKIL